MTIDNVSGKQLRISNYDSTCVIGRKGAMLCDSNKLSELLI